MKRPTHATVIAYLALFVALGGSAYAVAQLPKNSVGAKQLKPNAVTAAKVKSGAVTGAKIAADSVTGVNVDEATLGRVPNATTAEKATTAGHADSAAQASSAQHAATAGDAGSLGGVASSGYLRTDAVQFGSGALNACYGEKLAEFPSRFKIETVGDCQNEFKFRVTNLSAETWSFVAAANVSGVGANSSNILSFAGSLTHLFAIGASNPANHALIDCAYQAASVPPRISCSTRVPPAA